jgi:hypothetical protein
MDNKEVAQAQDQVKQTYLDQVAEINGTAYTFTKFTHKERKKVFAFLSSVNNPSTGAVRMDFWDEPRFEAIEELINSKVMVDGVQISKKPNFWDNEEYAADYVAFMLLAMQVISYPFIQGGFGK